jgi:hypothetical protein
MLVGNVYMGWQRDATSSYSQGIYAVVGLSVMCTLLTLSLMAWDHLHGGRLNKPRARYGYRSLP